MQAPTSSLAELGSIKRRRCFRVMLYILRMRRSVYHAGTSRTVRYRDIEGQDETPGLFETLGHAANLCVCAGFESSGHEANNGIGAHQAIRRDYLHNITCVSLYIMPELLVRSNIET